jgi:hypothetical protein
LAAAEAHSRREKPCAIGSKRNGLWRIAGRGHHWQAAVWRKRDTLKLNLTQVLRRRRHSENPTLLLKYCNSL